MFDLSLAEMAVIAVLAALVLGPKDLPVALRALGRGWRAARGVAAQFRRTLEEASGMDELRKEASFIRDEQGRLQQVYDISEFMDPDDHARKGRPPSGG